MLRLLGVEARRDLGRRLTWVLILLYLAVITVGVVIAWFNIDRYSPAEREALEEQAVERCIDEARYGGPDFGAEPGTVEIEPGVFVEVPPPATGEVDVDDAERHCRELLAAYWSGDPQGELFYYFYEDAPPRAVDIWNPYRNGDSLMTIVQLLLLLAALGAGASMIGAEWKAGTITTQLTWSTNRISVFGAKLVATVVLAAVIAYLLQIVFALELTALVVSKGGVMDAVGRDWLLDLAAGMARTSFVVGIAAALGASLAMIFRNTAAAIILVFGYVLIAESLLGVWKPQLVRWFLGPNLGIVLEGQSSADLEFVRHPLLASVTLLGYLAVIVILAALAFQRRDIAGSS
jgi:hypothetical protein